MSVSDYGSSQQISNALVQWGTAKSTIDGPQPQPFPQNYACPPSQIAVVTTRNNGGATAIMPASCTDKSFFTTDRYNEISGTKPFYWLSIGNLSSGSSGTSVLQGATIQWGTAVSQKDHEEHFDFNDRFKKGCEAVIVCRSDANTKNTFAVTTADKNGFKVNRNDSVTGDQNFYWIAIGDTSPNSKACFSFQMGKYTVKGGTATSKKDATQAFPFSALGLASFSKACETVVVNRKSANSRVILPAVSADRAEFSIDRNNEITGDQDFYWIAIGK